MNDVESWPLLTQPRAASFDSKGAATAHQGAATMELAGELLPSPPELLPRVDAATCVEPTRSVGDDRRRGRRPAVREDEEARRSARAGAALLFLSFSHAEVNNEEDSDRSNFFCLWGQI